MTNSSSAPSVTTIQLDDPVSATTFFEGGRDLPVAFDHVHVIPGHDRDLDIFAFPLQFIVDLNGLEDRVQIRIFRIGKAKAVGCGKTRLPANDRALYLCLEPYIIVTIDTQDKRPSLLHHNRNRD